MMRQSCIDPWGFTECSMQTVMFSITNFQIHSILFCSIRHLNLCFSSHLCIVEFRIFLKHSSWLTPFVQGAYIYVTSNLGICSIFRLCRVNWGSTQCAANWDFQIAQSNFAICILLPWAIFRLSPWAICRLSLEQSADCPMAQSAYCSREQFPDCHYFLMENAKCSIWESTDCHTFLRFRDCLA